MNYTIRPMELGDAPGFNILRRMPGVFENTLGLPSERGAAERGGLPAPGA